jgi:hypothetical protein
MSGISLGVLSSGALAAAPLRCRVGTAGRPAAPLTEPDLRASHPALWIVDSEDQTELVRDFRRGIHDTPEVIQ